MAAAEYSKNKNKIRMINYTTFPIVFVSRNPKKIYFDDPRSRSSIKVPLKVLVNKDRKYKGKMTLDHS